MLTVQVELPNRAKPITCATQLDDLEIGDRCLLEVEGKTRFGTIVRVPLDLTWPGKGPGAHVIRRASKADEERQLLIESRKEECIKIARELAVEFELPMKILRAEVPANVNKATIFFVSEGRVDFRQMVRELVKKLRMRVELRQIGARDAAAIQGGVGHCGEQLCCSRWLTTFSPVSMKMAKKQGLPLNPSKISGQCGRLMCCLRYELKDADIKKKKKKILTELPTVPPCQQEKPAEQRAEAPSEGQPKKKRRRRRRGRKRGEGPGPQGQGEGKSDGAKVDGPRSDRSAESRTSPPDSSRSSEGPTGGSGSHDAPSRGASGNESKPTNGTPERSDS